MFLGHDERSGMPCGALGTRIWASLVSSMVCFRSALGIATGFGQDRAGPDEGAVAIEKGQDPFTRISSCGQTGHAHRREDQDDHPAATLAASGEAGHLE